VKLEVDGLTFVVEDRDRHLIPGLRIEVQSLYGSRGLVAWNAGSEPSGSCGC
jgi:hypothetical protein